MDHTTDYQPFTPTEIEAIETGDADRDWHNEAQARIARAEALLDRISSDIETVPAHSREHAADLLDAAIELLERMTSRFSPDEPHPPEHEPPF